MIRIALMVMFISVCGIGNAQEKSLTEQILGKWQGDAELSLKYIFNKVDGKIPKDIVTRITKDITKHSSKTVEFRADGTAVVDNDIKLKFKVVNSDGNSNRGVLQLAFEDFAKAVDETPFSIEKVEGKSVLMFPISSSLKLLLVKKAKPEDNNSKKKKKSVRNK